MPVSRIAALFFFVLLAFPSGAVAEDETVPVERRSAQILDHVDRSRIDDPWLGRQIDRIHLDRRAGIAYTREIRAGDRKMRLRVRGPAYDRKNVGLGVELRF